MANLMVKSHWLDVPIVKYLSVSSQRRGVRSLSPSPPPVLSDPNSRKRTQQANLQRSQEENHLVPVGLRALEVTGGGDNGLHGTHAVVVVWLRTSTDE